MFNQEEFKKSFTNEEQRALVKYMFLQNYSCGLIHHSLVKSLGKKAISKSTIGLLARRFKTGDYSINDKRGGSQRDPGLNKRRVRMVREKLGERQDWSTRTLSESLGLPKSCVARILREDLCMHKVLGQWIPQSKDK